MTRLQHLPKLRRIPSRPKKQNRLPLCSTLLELDAIAFILDGDAGRDLDFPSTLAPDAHSLSSAKLFLAVHRRLPLPIAFALLEILSLGFGHAQRVKAVRISMRSPHQLRVLRRGLQRPKPP